MEDKKEYRIGNFIFDSEEEFNKGKKELYLIKTLKNKYDLDDPKIVQIILTKFKPETMIGKQFVTNMQKKVTEINTDPLLKEIDNALEKDVKRNEIPKKNQSQKYIGKRLLSGEKITVKPGENIFINTVSIIWSDRSIFLDEIQKICFKQTKNKDNCEISIVTKDNAILIVQVFKGSDFFLYLVSVATHKNIECSYKGMKNPTATNTGLYPYLFSFSSKEFFSVGILSVVISLIVSLYIFMCYGYNVGTINAYIAAFGGIFTAFIAYNLIPDENMGTKIIKIIAWGIIGIVVTIVYMVIVIRAFENINLFVGFVIAYGGLAFVFTHFINCYSRMKRWANFLIEYTKENCEN